MRKSLIVFLAIIGFLFVVGLSAFQWGVTSYNDLATQQEKVEQARSGMATDYQRRFDLIGQLVGATQGTNNVVNENEGVIKNGKIQLQNKS